MSDSWLPLLYSVGFVLLFGILVNLTVQPFIDDGVNVIKNPSPFLDILNNTLDLADFFVADVIIEFFKEQLIMLGYLPVMLSNIIIVILGIAIGYVLYALGTLLIP